MDGAIGFLSLDFSRLAYLLEGLNMLKRPKKRHLPRYLVKQLEDHLLKQNHGENLTGRM